MSIIDQLKANEKPYGLMSEEMQLMAIKMRSENFELWASNRWLKILTDRHLDWKFTYRLRPDYEDEPEIVECEIQVAGGTLFYQHNGTSKALGYAMGDPDGIGFKFAGYENDVFNSPIMYDFGGTMQGFRASIEDIKSGHAKVLHATHVCFRRRKQDVL